MAETRHAHVFAYDVESDRQRAKIAALLERELVRVQYSVFEGRLSLPQGRRLADQVFALMGPADGLRVYVLDEAALGLSFKKGGGAPLPETSDFLLF